jgi:hypothetical protein
MQAEYGEYLIADHRIMGATWPVLGLPLIPWSPGLVPLVSRRTPRNDGGKPKLARQRPGDAPEVRARRQH